MLFPGKSLGEWKFLYTRLFGGETSVLVAHKTHPLKAICKGARWKMMVLKVTFFHCFGFFIHLCWWSQTINYMPSGQLISCLIEPQSSSKGCYMALWRCSSKHRTIILCSTHIDCLCLKGSSAKPISQQSKKAALLLWGSNESREIDMSAPLSLSQKRDFTSLHVLLISSYSHFISDFTADHFYQQNISSKKLLAFVH